MFLYVTYKILSQRGKSPVQLTGSNLEKKTFWEYIKHIKAFKNNKNNFNLIKLLIKKSIFDTCFRSSFMIYKIFYYCGKFSN